MRTARKWLFCVLLIGCGGDSGGPVEQHDPPTLPPAPPPPVTASTLQKNSGDAQIAAVGSTVTAAPSVKATSSAGQPVSGVAVTFAVASGNGSITGANATTDGNGVASVGSWMLGSEGTNALTATASGLQPVTFSATGYKSYAGPLFETHAHIVQYRSLASEGILYRVDARAGATGTTAAQYVAGLNRNNIKCVVAFHGVALDSKQTELLDHARRLKSIYPGRFILLAEIFSTNPLDWFDANRTDVFFEDDLFRGFGEIQFLNEPLGDGQAPVIFPHDPRFLSIYDKLAQRRLLVMGHPASPQGVQTAIARNAQLTWLVHGPQVHSRWTNMANLETLLNNNPNMVYTIDMSESLPEFLQITKINQGARNADDFIASMSTNFLTYLDRMTTVWKDVVERHPDRFMWGTDMALPSWHWDPRVLDEMAKLGRAFTATLSTSTAESFAYRNAERVFGSCP